MFLSYCSENGISYEALEEEVGTYVPDVMGRWKRGTVVDSNTENAPLIPECMEMELGFDSGKYPAEIPEKKRLQNLLWNATSRCMQNDGKILILRLLC